MPINPRDLVLKGKVRWHRAPTLESESERGAQVTSKFLSVLIFSSAILILGACAHKNVVTDPEVVAEPTPAPIAKPVVKAQIRYIYADTLPTVSGTTAAPFEHPRVVQSSFGSKILKLFWPLLALMAAGLVFIAVLLLEHVVLNKQLAARADLRTRLRET